MLALSANIQPNEIINCIAKAIYYRNFSAKPTWDRNFHVYFFKNSNEAYLLTIFKTSRPTVAAETLFCNLSRLLTTIILILDSPKAKCLSLNQGSE